MQAGPKCVVLNATVLEWPTSPGGEYRVLRAGTNGWTCLPGQHSAHIAAGREGLCDLIKSLPPSLKYEPGTIVAEGDLVIVQGRFSGFGAPVNWIAADIVRAQNGILVEHWEVI